jgi:hypothetical protein
MTSPHNNPQGTAGSEQHARQSQPLDEYLLSMKIQIPKGMKPGGIESYIKDYIFVKGWGEPFESNYIHVEDFKFLPVHTSALTRQPQQEPLEVLNRLKEQAKAEWVSCDRGTEDSFAYIIDVLFPLAEMQMVHTSAPALTLYKTQIDDDGAVGKVAICLCEQCKVNGFLCQKSPRAITSAPAPVEDDAHFIYPNELQRLASNAYWTGDEKSNALSLIKSRSLLEHDAAIRAEAAKAAREQMLDTFTKLWRDNYCPEPKKACHSDDGKDYCPICILKESLRHQQEAEQPKEGR